MSDPLIPLVAAGLDRPVMPEAREMAAHLTEMHGDSVDAVLFYGSCLRDQTAEGVLDFYLLVNDYRAFHGGLAGAWANAVLPPTVRFVEIDGVAAKVAVISTAAFTRRMRPGALDTTLWARFCQPSALVWARDDGARAWVVDAVADALATAAGWGLALGPRGAKSGVLWEALFRQTYRAELRVERAGDRARAIYERAADHFDAALEPALARAERMQGWQWRDESWAQRAWALRVLVGKPLNLVRVVKGAFTFDGAADYIAWKIERHSGRALNLTEFQRRHPLIAAPRILWRLLRDRVVR
ncbi:MAG: hypothetical protein AAGF30_02710 [Pseudomonadota bacterium]